MNNIIEEALKYTHHQMISRNMLFEDNNENNNSNNKSVSMKYDIFYKFLNSEIYKNIKKINEKMPQFDDTIEKYIQKKYSINNEDFINFTNSIIQLLKDKSINEYIKNSIYNNDIRDYIISIIGKNLDYNKNTNDIINYSLSDNVFGNNDKLQNIFSIIIEKIVFLYLKNKINKDVYKKMIGLDIYNFLSSNDNEKIYNELINTLSNIIMNINSKNYFDVKNLNINDSDKLFDKFVDIINEKSNSILNFSDLLYITFFKKCIKIINDLKENPKVKDEDSKNIEEKIKMYQTNILYSFNAYYKLLNNFSKDIDQIQNTNITSSDIIQNLPNDISDKNDLSDVNTCIKIIKQLINKFYDIDLEDKFRMDESFKLLNEDKEKDNKNKITTLLILFQTFMKTYQGEISKAMDKIKDSKFENIFDNRHSLFSKDSFLWKNALLYYISYYLYSKILSYSVTKLSEDEIQKVLDKDRKITDLLKIFHACMGRYPNLDDVKNAKFVIDQINNSKAYINKIKNELVEFSDKKANDYKNLDYTIFKTSFEDLKQYGLNKDIKDNIYSDSYAYKVLLEIKNKLQDNKKLRNKYADLYKLVSSINDNDYEMIINNINNIGLTIIILPMSNTQIYTYRNILENLPIVKDNFILKQVFPYNPVLTIHRYFLQDKISKKIIGCISIKDVGSLIKNISKKIKISPIKINIL